MTTIAYKQGILASDSRVTDSETGIYGAIKKINKIDNCLVGGCGNAELVAWFLNNFAGRMFNKTTHNPYTTICNRREDEFQGLIITPRGKIFMVEASLIPFEIKSAGGLAIGSGAAFAMGAMASGKTAAEAVSIAMKFDVNSGGKVQKLKL